MQESAYMQFTKLIKADGQLREFNFLRKKSGERILFNIDVSDERGTRYYFNMLQSDSKWNIAGAPVPEWIAKTEKELASAIVEQEK